MAFVGYIQKDDGDFVLAAAGPTRAETLTRTFLRVTSMMNPLYAPNIDVQEKDITDEEAEEIEALCVKHLDEAN